MVRRVVSGTYSYLRNGFEAEKSVLFLLKCHKMRTFDNKLIVAIFRNFKATCETIIGCQKFYNLQKLCTSKTRPKNQVSGLPLFSEEYFNQLKDL